MRPPVPRSTWAAGVRRATETTRCFTSGAGSSSESLKTLQTKTRLHQAPAREAGFLLRHGDDAARREWSHVV